MMFFGSSVIPLYLVVVNGYLFGLMGYDKQQAKKNGWRVPEWNLLLMGIIGGGAGGLLAQRFFHHKTRKKTFYIVFVLGTILALLFIAFDFHLN